MAEEYDSYLNVLFIPFDAAKQHYRRNAKNGILGKKIIRGDEKAFAAVELEEPGIAMKPEDINTQLELIIQQSIPYKEESYLPIMFRIPQLIFLSEEPKKVSFPENFSVSVPFSPAKAAIKLEGERLVYTKIGQAGKKAVQRIFGYLLTYKGEKEVYWTAKAEIKIWEDQQGIYQHVLFVKLTPPDSMEYAPYTVAGVYLTSKNTAKKNPEVVNGILQHIAEKEGEIDLVIGDFNLDVKYGYDKAGHGSIEDKDTWVGSETGDLELQHTEQSSASVGMKHYMGWMLSGNAEARGLGSHQSQGISGQRFLRGGEYFSDHPPIFMSIARPLEKRQKIK